MGSNSTDERGEPGFSSPLPTPEEADAGHLPPAIRYLGTLAEMTRGGGGGIGDGFGEISGIEG
jgi:hypothetical protein